VDAYQHRDLGRQMLAILIEAAKAGGREGIELTTMQDNDNAFALYQKLGFRYIGDVENRTGDGRIVIERAMFYEIKPGARPMDKAHEAPV
jgi:ribosomal protein S18 acetylase RimI-like enzyme